MIVESDKKAVELYKKLESGNELDAKETEFLQRYVQDRIDLEEIGLKLGDLSEQAQGKYLMQGVLEIALNNDGKLSESEVTKAKEMANEIIKSFDKKVPEQNGAALTDILNSRGDVEKLAMDYVLANEFRRGDMKEKVPEAPKTSLWGEISGANDKKLEKYEKEVDDFVKERDNYKLVTGLEVKDDKVLAEALEKLGQAKLVDDLKPYGNTDGKAPSAKAEQEKSEGLEIK